MQVIKKILLSVILMQGVSVYSQQDPMYSMYLFDKMLINPAFTGSSGWAVATAKHRDQYMGLSGRPSTQTFNFHAPIQKKNIGLGIKIVNDNLGILTDQNAALDLSYHLSFAGGKLSFGIEGGMFRRTIKYGDLVLSSQFDKAIPATTETSMVPDASAGFYYQKRQFYLGVSRYHLLNQPFSETVNTGKSSKLFPHNYFLMGTVFDLGRFWQMEPSVFVKYQDAGIFQADANLMFYFDERFGLGAQYRTGDAIVGMIKIHITEGLRIAYSYDMTLSPLSTYGKASHEIILSYGIKLLPPAMQKEIHPRYYF